MIFQTHNAKLMVKDKKVNITITKGMVPLLSKGNNIWLCQDGHAQSTYTHLNSTKYNM
jgi:hypothetical protein